MAAQKNTHKIAVEIKTFGGLSEMDDLEKAIGQYIVYHDVLSKVEPDRVLYLIEHILTEHTKIPYAHGDIQIQTIFDHESDHYLLMLVGRDGIRRVHGCLVHVDIIDGKIYIQRDGTEYGIARELLEAGVPQDHLVLAFRAPDLRQSVGSAA